MTQRQTDIIKLPPPDYFSPDEKQIWKVIQQLVHYRIDINFIWGAAIRANMLRWQRDVEARRVPNEVPE